MADPTYLEPIDVNHNGKPVNCVVLFDDAPIKHLVVWEQLSKFDQLQLTNMIDNEFAGDPTTIPSLAALDVEPLPVNGQTFLATYGGTMISHTSTVSVQGSVIDKNTIYNDGAVWKHVHDDSAV